MTYPLLEQLCDLLFVLLQIIFHLREASHRELLPVVRTEVLQLGLGLACRREEAEEQFDRFTVKSDEEEHFKQSHYVRGQKTQLALNSCSDFI